MSSAIPWAQARPYADLTGPKGWPLVGMAPAFVRNPFGYVDEVRAFGTMVRVPFAGRHLLYLFDPDALSIVLGPKHRDFPKGEFAARGARVFGEGLLLSHGDHWHRQRRRMAPAFHRQVLMGFSATMEDIIDDHLDAWGPTPGTLAVEQEMMRLTLEVAVRTLFGTSTPRAEKDRVAKAFSVISAHFASIEGVVLQLPDWLPTPSNRRFDRAMDELDTVVQRIIDDRRASKDRGRDLLGRLLDGQDDDGQGMTDVQLRDEVRTLLLAGHETTAIGLTCGLWALSDPTLRMPDQASVQDAIAQQIHGVTGGGPLRAEHLPQLPLLEAAWKETLRLYPPAPAFFRETGEDTVLQGFQVPKGSTMVIPIWQLQREARWYTQPLEFDVQRWLDPDVVAARPKHAWMPFGAGPRICIGASLAMTEGQLALGEILRRYTLSRAPGAELSLVPAVTLRANAPVLLRFVAR